MMKRGFVIGILIALILISGVSALSIDLKDLYDQKETGIAKISGDIRQPITKSQISFYRGHVAVPSFEYDLVKIGNDYYVWFVTPNTANNYSIEVKDVSAVIAGSLKTTTLTKNFSVSGNLSDYYITPGAIVSNKDFNIEFVLNADDVEIIDINFPENRNVTINPGENTVKFSLSSLDKTKITTIIAGKYSIPAYLITNSVITNTTSNVGAENASNTSTRFDVSPKRIERTLNVNDDRTYPVEIFNLGGENLSDIKIDYNKKVLVIEPSLIESIAQNGSALLKLTVLGSENVEEVVTIRKDNVTINLFVKISFATTNTSNQSGGSIMFDCGIELGGKICTMEQICTGRTESSKQGSCCVGECISASGGSSSKAWIGWLIAIVVIGVIGYLYSKYKKVKPVGNPIEKQVRDIEKRDLTPNFMKK
jgi:hypothetical protein